MTGEFISKASNGVIEAKRPILERLCTQSCASNVFFSVYNFLPRHVHRPITLAVSEMVHNFYIQLKCLIYLLSNDMTNKIFF